ncbi:MAG TPA: SRPBCC family protein [Vicinamibacterales bacterium]|jgi:uncharacterized protein YndB with AHSA1/START domain
MLKWILIVLAVIIVIGALTAIVGWSLPVAHVASRQRTFAAPPEVVWRHMTDVDAFPSWRADVKRIERLPDRDGRAVWAEHGSNGRITLAVEKSEPPRLLVLRIADPDLPFGGTWTYEVAPASGGSTLTITERGEIYNPIFRAMARFVFGYEATMAAYLDALEKRVR